MSEEALRILIMSPVSLKKCALYKMWLSNIIKWSTVAHEIECST